MQHCGIVEVSEPPRIVFGAGFCPLRDIVLAALFGLFVREVGLNIIFSHAPLRSLVEILCPVCLFVSKESIALLL